LIPQRLRLIRLGMSRLVSKLLVLLAVLLMPLGMAPAAAGQASHHAMTMPMQHCPEQAPSEHKAGFVECTMACSAALPAVELARDGVVAGPAGLALPTIQPVLHGLHPETATPPPRHA